LRAVPFWPSVSDPSPEILHTEVTATPFLNSTDTPNFALAFSGSDVAAATKGASTFSLPAGDFTVDFWLRRETQTGQRTVVSLGDDELVIFLDGGTLKYRLTNNTGGVTERAITPLALPVGQWRHVALR